MSPGGIADGYLTAADSRDGYMYVFGKGKSQTTVEAPLTAVPKGQGIMIQGTVTDLSPAQPGTPCVSKASMTLQMEYLHLQMPEGGIWKNETITGVPVTSNSDRLRWLSHRHRHRHNQRILRHIQQSSGLRQRRTHTKSLLLSRATTSYGSSAASTAVSMGPAPATITIPEQVTPPDYTMTIVGVAIAIMIAVTIAVAAAILMLRKR